MARSLPIAEYASFGLFYALQAGLAAFVLAGIVEVSVGLTKNSGGPKYREYVYRLANTAFFFMAMAFIALALLVFWLFADDSSSNVSVVLATILGGIALGYSSLQSQIVRLQERHFDSLCFNFLVPLAGWLGGGIGLLMYQSVGSFFAGSAIGVLSGLLILWFVGIGDYRQADKLGESKLILLSLPPFLLMAGLGWLSGYGNNYLINYLLAAEDVAKFTFLLSLSAAMQLIASSLNLVWAPHFYRIAEQLPFGQVEKKNRTVFAWLGIVMGIAAAVLVCLFSPVLSLIGGNLAMYQSMGFELFLMSCAYIFLLPWWHCYNYFILHGKSHDLLRVSLITSLVGIAIWTMLMVALGPLGIYLGFLAQMVIKALGMALAARKHWAVTVAWEGVVGGCLVALVGFGISKA
jgi:O-antigen/teichoic acid export membrane protein